MFEKAAVDEICIDRIDRYPVDFRKEGFGKERTNRSPESGSRIPVIPLELALNDTGDDT